MSGPDPRPPQPWSAEPARAAWTAATPGQLPVDEHVRVQPAGSVDPHVTAHERLRAQTRALQELSAQLPFAPPRDRYDDYPTADFVDARVRPDPRRDPSEPYPRYLDTAEAPAPWLDPSEPAARSVDRPSAGAARVLEPHEIPTEEMPIIELPPLPRPIVGLGDVLAGNSAGRDMSAVTGGDDVAGMSSVDCGAGEGAAEGDGEVRWDRGRPRWRMPEPAFTDGRQGILEDIVTACTEGWQRSAELVVAGVRPSRGDDVPILFDEVADYIEEVHDRIRRHLGGFAFATAREMGLSGWAADALGRAVVALAPLHLADQLWLAPSVVRTMGGFLDNNDVAGSDGLVPPTLPHGTISRLADQVAGILDPLGEIPREKVGPRSRALQVNPLETAAVHLILHPPPYQPELVAYDDRAFEPEGWYEDEPGLDTGHRDSGEVWPPAAPAHDGDEFPFVDQRDTPPAPIPQVELDHPAPGRVPAIGIVRPATVSAPREQFDAPAPGPGPGMTELPDDVAECLRRARSMRMERRYAEPRIAGR